jgi:eukaryotic-like serine/threonine-protein kinase
VSAAKKIDVQQPMSTHGLGVADTLAADEAVAGMPLRVRCRLGGRYKIEGLLGTGGGGSVYQAHDTLLDERVAIKVMHPEAANAHRALKSFAKEVRLSRRIVHRNVARTFDLGEEAGVKFLTMQLIDGKPLHCMLRAGGSLPPLQHVISVGIEVCKGLSAVHAAGVIHCDLKPANIMLSRDGRVVITDFGVAREVCAAESAPGEERTSSGTPEYMAPEQIEQSPTLDGRVDIYALGVILYELLTGTLPFVGKTRFLTAVARLMKAPPNPRQVRPSLPQELAQIVLRCLSRNREDRYASAEDLGRALRALLQPH